MNFYEIIEIWPILKSQEMNMIVVRNQNVHTCLLLLFLTRGKPLVAQKLQKYVKNVWE